MPPSLPEGIRRSLLPEKEPSLEAVTIILVLMLAVVVSGTLVRTVPFSG